MEYNSFVEVIFATSYGIYMVDMKQKIQILSNEPCGFDSITTVIKQNDKD